MTAPYVQNINLVLPIAPNGTYRFISAPDTPLSQAMVPAEAVHWLTELRKGGTRVTSINLAGPGDPLASWPVTRNFLEFFAGIKDGEELIVTTLGLGVAPLVPEFVDLGVGTMIVLVETITSAKVENFYSWIRPGKKTLPLSQVAGILIREQAETVKACAEAGLKVIIRSMMSCENNGEELPAIAEVMAGYGAIAMEIGGTPAAMIRKKVGQFLPTSRFDPQDVVLPAGAPQFCRGDGDLPVASGDRTKVAVVSTGGMEVDLHLGQAEQLLIYGKRDDGLACLLEIRPVPPVGVSGRWQTLADNLTDCFCLLASHAGEAPRIQLAEVGIRVILTTYPIESMVDTLFGGGKRKKCLK